MLKVGIILTEINIEKLNMQEAIGLLTPKQQQTLASRLLGKTLEETGKELGVTRERVRQLEDAAIVKLFKSLIFQGIQMK